MNENLQDNVQVPQMKGYMKQNTNHDFTKQIS